MCVSPIYSMQWYSWAQLWSFFFFNQIRMYKPINSIIQCLLLQVLPPGSCPVQVPALTSWKFPDLSNLKRSKIWNSYHVHGIKAQEVEDQILAIFVQITKNTKVFVITLSVQKDSQYWGEGSTRKDNPGNRIGGKSRVPNY